MDKAQAQAQVEMEQAQGLALSRLTQLLPCLERMLPDMPESTAPEALAKMCVMFVCGYIHRTLYEIAALEEQ
jgi:hypothetical protein